MNERVAAELEALRGLNRSISSLHRMVASINKVVRKSRHPETRDLEAVRQSHARLAHLNEGWTLFFKGSRESR
ncbi:unnamed protein product [Lampetra fluviatilis]